MYKTTNKKESAKLIAQLNLNKFSTLYLNNYNEKAINSFIETYPAEFYAVRDMSKSNSKKFNLKVKKSDLVNYICDMSEICINVSSYNYIDNQLCTGEIIINDNMDLSLTISTEKGFSARDAVCFPEFNLITNIYDKNVWKINGIEHIIHYILKYNLINIIVEFSVFNLEVGINNENVIIYELRTDY